MSAGRFPPHLTLAGSLPVVSEIDLLRAVRAVADGHAEFALHNHGVDVLGASVVFDVDLDAAGAPNHALGRLVADVQHAVRPLLVDAPGLAADLPRPDQWRGHLTLASHELTGRADLRAEVEAYVRELAVPYPETFRARTVTVYRLQHSTWTGPWWADFTWEHLRSAPLGGGTQ